MFVDKRIEVREEEMEKLKEKGWQIREAIRICLAQPICKLISIA